jgi:hypothetical protein
MRARLTFFQRNPHQNERINWFSKGVRTVSADRVSLFLQKGVCLFANWKKIVAEKKRKEHQQA